MFNPFRASPHSWSRSSDWQTPWSSTCWGWNSCGWRTWCAAASRSSMLSATWAPTDRPWRTWKVMVVYSLLNYLCPIPHHTTRAMQVWAARCAQHVVLCWDIFLVKSAFANHPPIHPQHAVFCLNTFWGKSEFANHPPIHPHHVVLCLNTFWGKSEFANHPPIHPHHVVLCLNTFWGKSEFANHPPIHPHHVVLCLNTFWGKSEFANHHPSTADNCCHSNLKTTAEQFQAQALK